MTRFDLISPRARKGGKTFWQKIGAAFPRERGGYSLTFDALPLPDAEGRVTILMTEPKPRDDAGNVPQQNPAPQSGGIDDDEIPF